uniref:Glutathione S-transferase T3 n=1 Tax=Noccaea caerulescens TaxID=107243 RepID=A0A1J3CJ05_NOCCA
MASNPVFSYHRSFTYLLNQTSSPQTPGSCSQTPLFSTQTSSVGDADIVEENSPQPTREGRRRWTVPEDGALVSAWLNTSKDAIVGNEQRVGAFWKRVAAYYAASSAVKDLPTRESNTCKQRWGKINEAVQKFCGCYDQAGRQRTSGQSDDDVFEMAYNFYFQDQKSNFTMEHAWRMLRNDQKWCMSIEKGNSQSKRSQPDVSGTGSPMEDQGEERPMGVKAAKAAKFAKGKRNVKPTNEDREASLKNLQNVWEIRQKDLDMKAKLVDQEAKIADKNLLAKILGKTEPLTEMEIRLKNKLISEML